MLLLVSSLYLLQNNKAWILRAILLNSDVRETPVKNLEQLATTNQSGCPSRSPVFTASLLRNSYAPMIF